MKSKYLLILVFIAGSQQAFTQIKGCKDPQASNYNPLAQENDGSCQYAQTTFLPSVTCLKLNDTLLESSGLVYFNNRFWTHNDSDNPPYIYAFDSLSGGILHRTFISNKTNKDWEDMCQDSQFIYIGDFGNNGGNRTDLRILIIKKSDLKLQQASDTVLATEINFSFADQASFSNSNQAHDFDMEAFCVLGDSLHLFSKNWIDKKTRHYVCSKNPGTFILIPQESFFVNGQVTGACADEKRGIILLTGYNKADIACFAWLIWDFRHNRFGNGNKRRIELGTVVSFGQNEAICFRGRQVYLSNEKYLTESGLRRMEIEYLLSGKPLSNAVISKQAARFTAYQSQTLLIIKADPETLGKTVHIYTSDGKLLKSIVLDKTETSVDIDDLMEAVYILKVEDTAVKIYIRK